MYLKLGSGASLASFTLIVAAGGYYELPVINGSLYTGIVTAIWGGSPTGSVLVTEVTA